MWSREGGGWDGVEAFAGVAVSGAGAPTGLCGRIHEKAGAVRWQRESNPRFGKRACERRGSVPECGGVTPLRVGGRSQTSYAVLARADGFRAEFCDGLARCARAGRCRRGEGLALASQPTHSGTLPRYHSGAGSNSS